MEKTLATNPISTSTLQTRIENLERAWTEFKAQYDRLRTIAGRGRLQGLQAYHATLQSHCWVHIDKAEDALEEEQAKEAALKKVVMFGQKIAACEQSILAETEAKAIEKVEQENSRKEPSAGEGQAKEAAPGTTTGLSYAGLVGKAARKAKAAEKAARKEATKKEEASVNEEQAKEAALKKEAIYEMKIAAWKRTVQVRADAKEAHVKPIDTEATEKAADKKAALRKETIAESPLKKKATKKATFNEDTFENGCYFDVDHLRSCDYNDGNAGGNDLNDDEN